MCVTVSAESLLRLHQVVVLLDGNESCLPHATRASPKKAWLNEFAAVSFDMTQTLGSPDLVLNFQPDD